MRWIAAALLILVAALGLRLAYIGATPDFKIVDDARDYDVHAVSIAHGDGFSKELTGMPTAFRPPGYCYLLGAAYKVFGVQDRPAHDRIAVARPLGAVLGTIGVALIGLLALRFWGRRGALVAMVLAAIYVPGILVADAMMSEQLFVVFMLAALVSALWRRGSLATAALAGLFAGLAILTRANGLILLAPLAWAVWMAPRRNWRALLAPALLAVVALLVVAPWTIRNVREMHHFVPVTTQLGTALAGTYNSEARADPVNPGSWRSLRRIEEYAPLSANFRTTNEAEREQRLRKAGYEFIREHPGYLFTVWWWNTRRILDLSSRTWSRHTASTISVGPGWADVGVICFWIFLALAVVGAFRARGAPWWLWTVPLAMYLSVVFLAAETPRYRAPIDPFVILLAALFLDLVVGRAILKVHQVFGVLEVDQPRPAARDERLHQLRVQRDHPV
jgi:4-amino-4-deoxy-L-arabinose transferase-like glycosyltransferase